MKPILVIGDSCKDVWVYCKCNRLCPDAPVPVLTVDHVVENGGMAMNVYENIRALTTNVKIITNKNWNLVKKTRYVDLKTNQCFIRIDTNESDCNSFKDLKDTIDFNNYSAVAISDYNKGFLDEDDIDYISKAHPLTFLDTKRRLGKWCEDISFIKINRVEFSASEDVIKKNKKIRNNIIKTIGEKGTEYRDKIYAVKEVEVRDLSGAGDTFLAALVYGVIIGQTIENAIVHANNCATIVVQKKGVATISS